MNRYRVSRYLGRRRKTNLKRFPQVACFAFDSISSQIMLDGQYEVDILDFLHERVFPKLKQRRLCLDVGANIGNHSLSFARDFQRVQSFEPNARVFQLLQLNSQIVANVTAFQIGASDQKQQLPAYVWASNLGGATVEVGHAEKTAKRGQHVMHTFNLDRLDDLLSASDKQQVDFVKIDVEGHELSALQGAKELLTAAHPVIAFEVLRSGINQGQSDVITLLKSYGYSHFYEISSSIGGGRGFSRLATKLLPDWLLQSMVKTKFARVDTLQDKNYPMLLAVCGELEV
jgi:FkbM family methyltransferase